MVCYQTYGPKADIKQRKMSREKTIKSLRPDIPSIVISNNMTPNEKFQNEVIRPILKYQNDLILKYVLLKINSSKANYYQKDRSEKIAYIESILLRDNNVRQQLIGLTISCFTCDELEYYMLNESEHKKRINTMIKQRIVSQLDHIKPK